MIVCIAEKPSVARDIANVLGAHEAKQGYIEGNGYQVTWTFGHLCELKEPHEYNERWGRWDVYDLPMIPQRYGIRLKDDAGIKKQFAVIEGLFKNAKMIVNCGDAGQEGELIQRWVMQKAGVKCPVKRLWISSLTEEAIREGFQTLKDQSEYQSLYEAGLSRAIGDWTLGLNATRLYTMKYQQQRGQVLSIGRVQTPTLALIVNRQKEIETFEPRQSWLLTTLYRGVKFTAVAVDEDAEAEKAAEAAESGKAAKSKTPTYKQIEYETEQEGMDVLNAIKDSVLKVVDVQKKKGSEAPPRLYDLTSLQVDCNKKFSMSAEQTLQTIQSLYEKKFTTYPRVDTTFLPDDIYPKCPAILRGLRGYEPYCQPLEGKQLIKSKKVFDSAKVTDHHAIIPTGVPAQAMSDMEKKVYDLVVRAFIAVFYPDCKFETTTVMGECERNGNAEEGKETVMFRATGKVITDEGWKIIYKKDTDKGDTSDSGEDAGDGGTDEVGLPVFNKGESGEHVPSLQERWTQPPKPYTEATLLRAMETAGKFVDDEQLRDAMKENGIGRPSTRAAIIETLFKRRYIKKERKNLVATPTGVELISLIHEELLKSAELTGLWEKKLRDIEHHRYSAQQFIDELKQMVVEIVNTVRNDKSNRHVAYTTDEELKKKRSPVTPKASSTTAKASKKEGEAPAGFKPRKKKTEAAAPKEKGAEAFDSDQWIGMTCPVCRQGTIIKGKTAYGCSRWREGCSYRMPFEKIGGE